MFPTPRPCPEHHVPSTLALLAAGSDIAGHVRRKGPSGGGVSEGTASRRRVVLTHLPQYSARVETGLLRARAGWVRCGGACGSMEVGEEIERLATSTKYSTATRVREPCLEEAHKIKNARVVVSKSTR